MGKGKQSGFTLLEILVSFTLVAIILSIMYAGISTIYRASNSGESQITSTSQLRSVHTLLRKQLTGILPIIANTDTSNIVTGNQPALYFEGDERSMQFVATMPGHLRHTGVYRQTIEFDNDNFLRFRFEPVNSLVDGALEDLEPVALLSAEEVRFQYLDNLEQAEDVEAEQQWRDDWDIVGRVPALIRIDIVFNENSKVVWPPLIVAPARQLNEFE